MQRGAPKRDCDAFSKEEFYAGIKIVLTREEQAHFELGTLDKASFLDRIEPHVRSFAKNGFRKPKEVAYLLNKGGIKTACGGTWNPRLAWFLLGFLFSAERRNSRVRASSAVGRLPHRTVALSSSGRQPLTEVEIEKRRAAILMAMARKA
jgi:hypothetical protein